jgi:hypothetical protein
VSNAALILAGLAMGVAASPHCVAMCGAPCAALTSGCGRQAAGFHLGRLLGYAAGGAVAASSVIALGTWSQAAPALRPLWLLLHLGFLALGLWWLATGRQPSWMQRNTAVPIRIVVRRSRPSQVIRSSFAGLAWVAWPCAALQAGLLLAALANSALGGGLTMAAFALGSMPSLALAPLARARWQAWQGSRGTAPSADQMAMLGFRVAGLGVMLSSGWALTHGLWMKLAAFCGI